MEATTAKIPDATVIGRLAVAFVYFPELGVKCGSSTCNALGGAAEWGSPSFQRTMKFNVGISIFNNGQVSTFQQLPPLELTPPGYLRVAITPLSVRKSLKLA